MDVIVWRAGWKQTVVGRREDWDALPDSDSCGPHTCILAQGRAYVETAGGRRVITLVPGQIWGPVSPVSQKDYGTSRIACEWISGQKPRERVLAELS
eukprot:711643-Amphidinium_carterae.1